MLLMHFRNTKNTHGMNEKDAFSENMFYVQKKN